MKTFKVFLTALFAAFLSTTTNAQSHDHSSQADVKANQTQVIKESGNAASVKAESFKVSGVCGMCKSRIEKTVRAEGAGSATWDSKTQLLTVSFDPSKLNSEVLSKKLAAVGHDTEKYKASDEVYSKLPGCCKYERTK